MRRGHRLKTILPLILAAALLAPTGPGEAPRRGEASGLVFYVRAGAAPGGDGSNWGQAFTQLPSNLRRGATYYVGSGTYPGYVFAVPEEGDLTITVKKATLSDHGTEESWSDAYASGQALFGPLWFKRGGHYVLDGQERTSPTEGHGIKIKVDTPNGKGIKFDTGDPRVAPVSHVTVRYVEIEHRGRNTENSDDGVYGIDRGAGGPSHLVFQGCYIHDLGRVAFLMRNWNQVLIEDCVMARNASSPTNHAQGISDYGSDQVTIRYNQWEDIEGTSIITSMDSGVAEDWEIYGNVFRHTLEYGAPPNHEGVAGAIRVIRSAGDPGAVARNWRIHNNSFINLQGLWSGIRIDDGSNNVAYNNLWYRSVRTAHYGIQISHSWYFDTPRDGDEEEVQIGSGDPFVDLEGGDFRLSAPTDPGLSLPEPFTRDRRGVQRGADGIWDRGAFEYVASDGRFEDVPQDHWANSDIEALYREGYVAGCSESPPRYCPERVMNRAEGAVFVVRGILGAEFTPPLPTERIFSDVDLGDWHVDWVTQLWAEGYTSGCWEEPLRYCPLQGHTRAEAAVFFLRMSNGKDFLPEEPITQHYLDVPTGLSAPWYSKWVYAAWEQGILGACEAPDQRVDDLFRPLEGLTRSEAACMMARAKGLPPHSDS